MKENLKLNIIIRILQNWILSTEFSTLVYVEGCECGEERVYQGGRGSPRQWYTHHLGGGGREGDQG